MGASSDRVSIRYMCDFETLTGTPTRVWEWGLVSINDLDTFQWGTNISTFMEFVSRETCTCYFHNLKFDGMFIVDYLLRNGIEWHESLKHVDEGFTTVIGDNGQWYSIKYKRGTTYTTFLDSLKLIPMPVASIPKAFGLQDRKLEMAYDGDRPEGYIPTEEEVNYLRGDVVIPAKALDVMFTEGHTKMTISSNAFADLKESVPEWDNMFPTLDLAIDADCRKSYKGGWSYVNPSIQGAMVGSGSVYDVNSMYPHVMRDKPIPYGVPIYYTGKYAADELYPEYICCIEAELKLKQGKYPSIQLKGSIHSVEDEYITETNGLVLLHLTRPDYELMLECYDVLAVNYIGGYKFKRCTGAFAAYINRWYGRKNMAKEDNNAGMYTISKLFLNGSYGKIGTNPIKRMKIPYLDAESCVIKFKLSDEKIRNIGYVPVASYITAHARSIIIRAANKCGPRFLYADTDSLHILGNRPPDIPISDTELGAFKLESVFDRAKYLRPKAYIEEYNGKLDKKLAGLPKQCRGSLNFDTLERGHTFDGKLMPKVVQGGVILRETKFRIK